MSEVVVVGSGVIGLTTAVRLAGAGFATEMVTRDLPDRTTSSKAAAIWFPYQAKPPEKIKKWARLSYHYYGVLSSLELDAGVRFVNLLSLSRRDKPDLFWLEVEYPYRSLRRSERPKGFSHGFSVVVPFVNSTTFLSFLLQRFLDLGGKLTEAKVDDLALACPAKGVVVNCTGLGAADLAPDDQLYPISGQIVRVRSNRELRYVADDSAKQPFYVIPRDEDCILGGTAHAYDADETPSAEISKMILSACERLEPALAGCEVLETYVGLRPGRSAVRLELEPLRDGRQVIHNYGHGGSGFTLCWGCAEEVLQHVRSLCLRRRLS